MKKSLYLQMCGEYELLLMCALDHGSELCKTLHEQYNTRLYIDNIRLIVNK